MHAPSVRGCQYAVGIDFGTTFSGVAFASIVPSLTLADLLSAQSPVVHFVGDFDQATFQKTRTCLLLQRGPMPRPRLWGTDAFTKFVLPSEDRERFRGCEFVELFKPVLCTDDRIRQFEARYPFLKKRRLSAVVRAIAMFLRELKDRVIKEIKRVNLGRVVTPRSIKWVVTCPARWGDRQKGLMRDACMEAGLFSSLVECTPDRFKLVCEPEAATVRVLQSNQTIHNLAKEKPVNVMVVDAGGGTIDVTSYCASCEEGKPHLDMIVKPSASTTGGSSAVDEGFRKWFIEVVGDPLAGLLENDINGPVFRKLVSNFEETKIRFDGRLPEVRVDVPDPVVELLQAHASRDVLVRLGNQIGASPPVIVLSKRDMLMFYRDSVEMIKRKVQKQLTRLEDKRVDFVVLVGGLGSSPVIQSATKKLCERSGRCGPVFTAANPCLAVLSGAVLYGLFPDVIRSRRSPVSYGLGYSVPYNPRIHRLQDSMEDGGRRFVLFARCVLPQGEVVIDQHEQVDEWRISRDGQDQVDFRLYSVNRRIEVGQFWMVTNETEDCRVEFPITQRMLRGDPFTTRLVFSDMIRLHVSGLRGYAPDTRVPSFLAGWRSRAQGD